MLFKGKTARAQSAVNQSEDEEQDTKSTLAKAEAALTAARAARTSLSDQEADLAKRLGAAQTELAETIEANADLVYRAKVGGTATDKDLQKYNATRRAAEEEVANLQLALKETQRRHMEADRNVYAADADYRLARGAVLVEAILALDRKIDEHFHAGGAMFGERERLLEELNHTGALRRGVSARLDARISEWMVGRLFAHLVTAPDAPKDLTIAFPNLQQYRAAASTLVDMDLATLDLLRPDAEAEWRSAQPHDQHGNIIGPDYEEVLAERRKRAGVLEDERYRVPHDPHLRGKSNVDEHGRDPVTGHVVFDGATGRRMGGKSEGET